MSLMHPRAIVAFASLAVIASPASAVRQYPSAQEAEATLASGDLDSLYLSFGALKPGQHPDGDKRISALLTRAAGEAAKKKDPALTVGFASKARELDATNVAACLAEADAALLLKNRGEAEEALDAALKAVPTSWPLVLRRAKFAREEGEIELARDLLMRIPKDVPEAIAAKEELAALDTAAERAVDREAVRDDEQRPPPAPRVARATVPAEPDEETLPGYAARSSEHFRITYSEGQRDFAQKAGYEQQCLDLFERAYARVHEALGEGTSKPTEVVLYTREEFSFHFGGRFGNSILGFFAGKIRMNRADTIDDTFFDTAVHEYTHAVIDSMASGGHIPTWVHEGLARWVERTSAGNEPANLQERRLMKRVNPLPTLAELTDRGFAELSGVMVPVAYAKSALAIDSIIHSGFGLAGLERAIRGTAGGTSFTNSFATEFGATRLASLDGEVARALE